MVHNFLVDSFHRDSKLWMICSGYCKSIVPMFCPPKSGNLPTLLKLLTLHSMQTDKVVRSASASSNAGALGIIGVEAAGHTDVPQLQPGSAKYLALRQLLQPEMREGQFDIVSDPGSHILGMDILH